MQDYKPFTEKPAALTWEPRAVDELFAQVQKDQTYYIYVIDPEFGYIGPQLRAFTSPRALARTCRQFSGGEARAVQAPMPWEAVRGWWTYAPRREGFYTVNPDGPDKHLLPATAPADKWYKYDPQALLLGSPSPKAARLLRKGISTCIRVFRKDLCQTGGLKTATEQTKAVQGAC